MADPVFRLGCVAIATALAYHALTGQSHPVQAEKDKRRADTDVGAAIVKTAMSQRGVPYSWGGGNIRGTSRGICCSPSGADGRKVVGFDCSGLVQYAVYKATDGRITTPRTSQQQARTGKPVSKANMRPGDLIGFDHGRGVTHIGIYIGDGRMVHAPQTGDVVKVSPLAARTKQRWVIRRIH